MVPGPKPSSDSLFSPNLNEDLVAFTDPKRCLTGSSQLLGGLASVLQ